MEIQKKGFIKFNVIVFIVAIVAVCSIIASLFILLKSKNNFFEQVKKPQAESFLDKEKKGEMKTVTMLPTGFSPETVEITPGDIVNVVNTTGVNVKLKIDMKGGIIVIIPSGKNSYLSNFDTTGTYAISNADKSDMKGKVVVK